MLRPRVLLCLIVALVAGCSGQTAEERRFDLVSTGMTRDRVARLLGVPWKTDLSFEPGGYRALMKNDKLDTVSKPVSNSGITHSVSPSELASLGLRPGASIADVEASLGQPASECSQYYVNDVFAFEVCFKAGRVLSKNKYELPII